MDLQLTDDQRLFQDTAVRFAEARAPRSTVRALLDDPAGIPADYVEAAAALGWFCGFVPEELGGGSVSRRPLLDLAIVAEERGRRLQPGPFTGANVAAAALAHLVDDDLRRAILTDLGAGRALATWAAADPAGSYAAGAGVHGSPTADGWVLTGTKGLVEDAATATWLVVAACDGEDVVQVLVPASADGVTVQPVEGLDLTRRLAQITFDEVVVPRTAACRTDPDRLLDLAALLTVADLLGAVDGLLGMTVQYANDRIAFGRPIGSFQGVKHPLADLAMRAEAARAVAVAATHARHDERDDASETASIAKAFSGDLALDVAQGCFQVHGGIGFTWEHDLHLYLRRLSADAALYGDARWHRDRICQAHGL